jgi:predicted nuclease of predicted toxin-antitoxin system
VQDVDLRQIDDPTILAWAAENERIILTHDRSTMPNFAYQRLVRKEVMVGLFVVNDRTSVRQVISCPLMYPE